ncbi:hypothetical protein SEVIR_4G066250v4 [Setaria viridis]
MKQRSENIRLHVLDGYVLAGLLLHWPIELRLEDRRPHRKHNPMGRKSLASDLQCHVRPFLPHKQLSKIVRQVRGRHGHLTKVQLYPWFLVGYHSDVTLDHDAVVAHVRRRFQHALLLETARAQGATPTVGFRGEQPWFRHVAQDHGLPGGLLIDQPQVEGCHGLGVLAYKLEVDRGVVRVPVSPGAVGPSG